MNRLMPRKRTILGGVLAVGIVAGIWFGDKLPHLGSGFGLGSGGDGLIGKPDASNVEVNAASADKKPGRDEAESAQKEKVSAKVRQHTVADKLPPDDVLTVLVEEHHYAVWKKTRRGNGYFPTELPAIVDLALKTPANTEGLRVRVVSTKAARYPAWHALQQKLVEAGVSADAIVLTDELVD